MNSNQPITPLGHRSTLFGHALLFVIGFSLIFIIGWGGAATLLGQVFGQNKSIIARVGGLIVILFGLSTLGLLHLPWINTDTRLGWGGQKKQGWTASLLMGMFFAAGWTPCIGTTLGAILTLGFSQQDSGKAMFLTSGYAAGLGLPFLALGLGLEHTWQVTQKLKRHMPLIQTISGVFLIAIGLLVVFNQMTWIAIWAQRNGWFLDLPTAGVPSIFIAFLAGMISFFSPCVLPLVPAYLGYLTGHAVNATRQQAGQQSS